MFNTLIKALLQDKVLLTLYKDTILKLKKDIYLFFTGISRQNHIIYDYLLKIIQN